MEATLRKTMTSVTDTLFPVSRSTKDPQQHQILKAGNEYVTSLPLQMAVFFNSFFSPFWLTVVIVILELKYVHLNFLYRITLIAVYIIYSIIEVTRLYLGYVGNLMERLSVFNGSSNGGPVGGRWEHAMGNLTIGVHPYRNPDWRPGLALTYVFGILYATVESGYTPYVPELAGFWLLTLLLQLPLITLLLFYTNAMLLPLERAMHIIEGLFVVFEVVCGYIAIRHMVNYQVTKFHLRQFTDIEEMPDEDYWMDNRDDEDHDHYS